MSKIDHKFPLVPYIILVLVVCLAIWGMVIFRTMTQPEEPNGYHLNDTKDLESLVVRVDHLERKLNDTDRAMEIVR